MKNLLLLLLLALGANNLNISAEMKNYINDNEALVKELVKNNTNNLSLISQYSNLLISMIYQESTFTNNSVGDGGAAIGILQIHKQMVDECNRILKKNMYTYADRLSPEKSIEMFLVYQLFWNPDSNLETAARIWNAGPQALKKNQGIEYWLTIQNHMANNELIAQYSNELSKLNV